MSGCLDVLLQFLKAHIFIIFRHKTVKLITVQLCFVIVLLLAWLCLAAVAIKTSPLKLTKNVQGQNGTEKSKIQCTSMCHCYFNI